MTYDEHLRERIRRTTERRFGYLFWMLLIQDVLLFALFAWLLLRVV